MNNQEIMDFWKQVYVAYVSSHDEGDLSTSIADIAEIIANKAINSLEATAKKLDW